MKKLCLLLILFLSFQIVKAQDDDEETRNYPFGIGPYAALKAGTNLRTLPNNWKNKFEFNGMPDIGLSVYMPFSNDSKLGIIGNVGYSTYAFGVNMGQQSFSDKYGFLSIEPSVYYNSFYAGLALGIPISASRSVSTLSVPGTVATEYMTTLVELHIGGMYPVIEDQLGRLNIFGQIGWVMSGIYDKGFIDKTPYYTDNYNPQPLAVSIGVNYIFNLGR